MRKVTFTSQGSITIFTLTLVANMSWCGQSSQFHIWYRSQGQIYRLTCRDASSIEQTINSLSEDREACEYYDLLLDRETFHKASFLADQHYRRVNKEGGRKILDVSIPMTVQVDEEPWDWDTLSPFISKCLLSALRFSSLHC